jgi:hypothetical protein
MVVRTQLCALLLLLLLLLLLQHRKPQTISSAYLQHALSPQGSCSQGWQINAHAARTSNYGKRTQTVHCFNAHVPRIGYVCSCFSDSSSTV